MTSFDEIRQALAQVAAWTDDARAHTVRARECLDQTARLFADLDGRTHDDLPTAAVDRARDGVAEAMTGIEAAGQIVADLGAGL